VERTTSHNWGFEGETSTEKLGIGQSMTTSGGQFNNMAFGGRNAVE
jgi:hypothetical protein